MNIRVIVPLLAVLLVVEAAPGARGPYMASGLAGVKHGVAPVFVAPVESFLTPDRGML